MCTLLLRLAGPMQAWGAQDRFSVRFTGREPSKSGVVGLLCAAFGRPRGEPVDDLAALRMGVRVDAEGVVSRDYHTAGGTHRRGETYGVIRASGGLSHDTVPSSRYYLADADFLVGLEGPFEQLLHIEEALRAPIWQLCLGRKAFVAGVPMHLPEPGGVREALSLEEALRGEPWPRPDAVLPRALRPPSTLRFVIECGPGESNEARMDQPTGAAFQDRSFSPRYVITKFKELGTEVPHRRDDRVSVTSDP